ncbi:MULTISPECIES: glycosyltransferase family 2 protein [Levilactobacillus]|uniref:glycosyltransferase family 2 protein n=1 Tax=Levilactobacillus TaxID=2767886 RepID=UPI003756700B
MKLQVVITMAGQGSRFRKVGYTVPKHEIEVRGKSLFEWAMLSLKDFVNEKFVFVVREGQYQPDNLRKLIQKAGIHRYKIVTVSEVTRGQAATVMAAASVLNPKDSLAVYNIDTYVLPGHILREDLRGCDGNLTTFTAPGDHWSFVELDDAGKVTDVVEKRRVSEHASVGFYYFNTFGDFVEIYRHYGDAIQAEYGEVYVAPMYHYLLKQQAKITYTDIPFNTVHVLGTPEELAVFKEAATE